MPGIDKNTVRRLIPTRVIPGIVKRKIDRVRQDPGFRGLSEAQMRFLLEHTERAPEIPELARAHAEFMLLRKYMRWHPRAIDHQEVRGAEWLTTRRDLDRPVLLSFMHHGYYDGLFPSLKRAGAELRTIMTHLTEGADAPSEFKQHRRVVASGTVLFPETLGTQGIIDLMEPGVVLALASDVPGRTPVTFLGREVLGSFGAARIATITNSPVVLVTQQREGDGGYVQVHEPLEPSDYPDPSDLLADMLRRHEPAVLAWPEAVEVPLGRFGALDAATPS